MWMIESKSASIWMLFIHSITKKKTKKQGNDYKERAKKKTNKKQLIFLYKYVQYAARKKTTNKQHFLLV